MSWARTRLGLTIGDCKSLNGRYAYAHMAGQRTRGASVVDDPSSHTPRARCTRAICFMHSNRKLATMSAIGSPLVARRLVNIWIVSDVRRPSLCIMHMHMQMHAVMGGTDPLSLLSTRVQLVLLSEGRIQRQDRAGARLGSTIAIAIHATPHGDTESQTRSRGRSLDLALASGPL